ncbi:hypothetical protein [Aeromicrobium fastidiosum]|uniref:Uncharacterized protein n=1 Tax=Aeromicrobium fastidiosum TaxID=52699 RepID=A0A641ART6_9ACTN|nr:hypothetical protein [Aeromicrobium fastidiosum]KAA1380659.1 hypothetical protein ESP62_005670 [Aeromicrobium fastidiosum]MBP2390267.1 hypothetical protein [Aeromicrobium fastidiosum]
MVGRGVGVTAGLAGRPTLGGLPVPFACEDDGGALDHSHVVKKRAIRCALSRVCGICGEPLTRPVAFIGGSEEAEAGAFDFPPTHLHCAQEALDLFAPIGGRHLGHAEPPLTWAIVTTGGFDLIRPTRRGDPVHFRPNSVLETQLVD